MSLSVPTSYFGTYVGNLANYELMGILVVQVYFYYLTFQKDRFVLKALVFVVLCIDIAQTIFATRYVWNLLALSSPPINGPPAEGWSMGALFPLAGSVAFVIQCFFAWRIWILGGKPRVLIPIVAGVLLTALASWVLSFTLALDKHLTKGISEVAVIGWLVLGLICDLMITATLVIQLRSKRDKDFQYVNHVLHRASRMALETGGVTSALATAELVLYLTSGHIYFFGVIIISGKIYSNSLLASLNSRAPTFRQSTIEDENRSGTTLLNRTYSGPRGTGLGSS